MQVDKNEGCEGKLFNNPVRFHPATFRTDLTVTQWCQRTASSKRIHFLAHHSLMAALILLAICVQKGKFLVVLLSVYLKD